MNHKVFSVRDNKADAFLPPFFLPNRAMAVRSFSECANDDSHSFCKHSEDFTLYELGEFDDHAGAIVTYDVPQLVAVAASLKEKPFRMISEIGDAVERSKCA